MADPTGLPDLVVDTGSLEAILGLLGEGAYAVDRDRRIIFWNHAAEKISGYLAADVIGSKCSDNLLRHVNAEGIEICTNGCPLFATMQDGRSREAEVFMHHRSGHRVPVLVRSAPLYGKKGEIAGSLEIFSDRSDRSTLLSELELLRREILIDHLTGLGNRRYLELVSDARFALLRESGKGFGLLLADIDRFKDVNDTFGHLDGDRALVMAARTVLGAVRPMDVAIRFGGDEFVILCSNCGVEELAKVAERIRILTEHAWLDLEPEGRITVTLSIGGATASKADDLKSLLAKADARLYECKQAGRNRSVIGS